MKGGGEWVGLGLNLPFFIQKERTIASRKTKSEIISYKDLSKETEICPNFKNQSTNIKSEFTNLPADNLWI